MLENGYIDVPPGPRARLHWARGPTPLDALRDRPRLAKTIGCLWLHTCTLDHPRALQFYMRSGFRPFRRQILITDDPRLTMGFPTGAAPHVPLI
jgi:hypothetical protein